MNDDEFFNATTELRTIYQWARARYAAPWAVLIAVLLRVAASTGPHVQLPGVIGGRASLNMMAVFVSASGGGKGISDKVARLVWPTPILELPLGSGEGISEPFVQRGKPDEDNERVSSVLFNVPEIDTLAGLAARQGAIVLAQIKSAVMGEQIGQANASKATTRIVAPHTARICFGISSQPGHAGVIFNDTTGGTPQRSLWVKTTDPDMPAVQAAEPAPLNTSLPDWATKDRETVEIQYGPSEIAEQIVAAHLARQRGEGDALDGHWMLTRCKVAAVIAILHHRSVISELDWQLSAVVMAKSDSTRDWMIDHARQAARAKVRERAQARAAGEDFYDASRLETVKRSLLRMLETDGEQPEGKLKARLGNREKRDLFEQAITLLETSGQVSQRTYEYRGREVKAWSWLTGESTINPQVRMVDDLVNHDDFASITDLDSRRSHETEAPKLIAREWVDQHVAALLRAGQTTANSFAVYQAGETAGYTRQQLRVAVSDNPNITVIGRDGKTAIWDLTGTRTVRHRSAAAWTADYLNAFSAGEVVDKERFRHAATAAGYSWTAARHAATESGRIESLPGTGSETIWQIAPTDAEDAS